ncbi:MAG: hypothetical protein M1839_003449 [Geoglossum umbratile]|nr:MAG: hypothetical protein M1839_003449 [Geoglossum umbratile]
MSSGSLKEVVRALILALSSPKLSHSLPEELQQVVQLYLDRHQNIEDHESQRLHDELLNLYNKYVAKDADKHPTFMAALRQLRPAIKGTTRLLEWWDLLVRPTLDSLGQEKAVISDAGAILLSVLVYDEDEDEDGEKARASAIFTGKLLEVYLDKTRLLTGDGQKVLPEDERYRFVSNHLESLLVSFGRKRPKDFLTAIDALVVEREYRSQALSLLGTFVRFQPPHLHQVLQTPLLEHLLTCLMVDTSTTVLSLALTTLVMFLPHIPNSLVPYLPRLFIVYSRILCWERYSPARSDESEDADRPMPKPGSISDPTWGKLDYSFDSTDSTIPELVHYFTFLYGLYPLNFMSYIRKPYKYLQNARFPGADEADLDEVAIRHRTEQFQQIHLLHPNFFNMTVEAELTDLNRWMKSEPADVVAECMGLCATIPSCPDDPGPPPTAKLPDIPEAFVPTEDIPMQSLLSMDEEGLTVGNEVGSLGECRPHSNWRNTQSTLAVSHLSYGAPEHLQILRKSSQHSNSHHSSRSNGTHSRKESPAFKARDNALDSPTLPAHLVGSNTEAKLQDMLHTQESLRSSVHQSLPNESVNSLNPQEAPSPGLDAYINSLAQSTVARSPAARPASSDAQGNIAFLQREVMLLRNDLNFERYLKQQHISHIGQLQRKHIREATVEAETQNLINTNRALKLRLEESKLSYAKLRKETMASKNHAKKWEAELNARIRTLREEQKQWRAEEEAVRRELRSARQECDHLRRLVVESEAKELLSKQKLQSLDSNLAALDQLRNEVEMLSARLRRYEAKEDEYEMAKQNEENVITELETMRLKMRAREGEREKMRRSYEQRITELESRVNSKGNPIPSSPSAGFQSMLDSALAASHSRFAHLKKAHNHLLARYSELEMKLIELQAFNEIQAPPNSSGSNGRTRSNFRDDIHPLERDDASVDFRRRQHAFSDPLALPEEYSTRGHLTSATGNISSSYPNPQTNMRPNTPKHQKYPVSNSGSPVAERNTPFEASLAPISSWKTQQSVPDSILSSNDNGSVHSVEDTKGSKPKIKPTSEVRVYGRGGVQNIGKKDKKDKKASKSGGTLSSIRGIMQ